jgi:phospholipid/cholesterol/gamma-HCH transport system substrate-binding protein
MNTNTPKVKVRLGLFIAGGLAIFVIAIFLIGKQKHLFDPVFKLTATFYNVSGLQVGSNIRFSGITVGTVDNIVIINDTTVRVDMLLKKDVQRFIKADCIAGIGSSGLIGDRVLVITQGSSNAPVSKDGQQIASTEPVEIDAIMASLLVTGRNAEIISHQAAEVVSKINGGKGIVGKLFQDTAMAENISEAIVSIRKSSKGLNENMDAAQHNFLLRGYFKKKENAAQNVKDSTAEKAAKEQNVIQKEKKEEKAAQKVKDKADEKMK